MINFAGRVQAIAKRLIIRLPDEASAQLSSRGQVAVLATAKQQTFMIIVEPDGRRGHWLSIGDALRRALKVDVGDLLDLSLEPAKDWPEPELPEDLRVALHAAPDTAELWASIPPMARWEWVRWVQATRSAETRQRRIEVSISKLRSGKRRPCCFDLSSCTDPELARGGKLLNAD